MQKLRKGIEWGGGGGEIFMKKGPFLTNIKHCPKFLEHAPVRYDCSKPKTTATLIFRKHFYSTKLSNNKVSFFIALHNSLWRVMKKDTLLFESLLE